MRMTILLATNVAHIAWYIHALSIRHMLPHEMVARSVVESILIISSMARHSAG